MTTTTARKATKTDSITVKPYTVPVEWVEVTVQIPAALADELEQRTDYIQSLYGSDVWSVSISVISHAKVGDSPADIHARLKAIPMRPRFIESGLLPPTGRRLRAFTIKLEKQWWQNAAKASELLGVTASAFVRAALLERSRGLREFNLRQAAIKNGGRA